MADKIEIDIEDTVEGGEINTDTLKSKSLFKKLFTLKMIIIYCVAVLIIAGSLFAWWFFFLKGSDKAALEKLKQDKQQTEAENKTVNKKKLPVFKDIVELAPFVKIKLRPSGHFLFISMNIALQLENDNMRQSIESEKISIRSIIKHETEKMTWLVLRNPEGKLRLKYRLIEKINSGLSKSSSAKIKNLYFTHFIMQ